MDMSLGKTNYCLRALIEKGLVKAENFRQSRHKTRYLYNLTPHGLEEKAKVTARFLKQKLRQYEELKAEIEKLKAETGE
jgi:EPS-associated MarR family transcriptional regulator